MHKTTPRKLAAATVALAAVTVFTPASAVALPSPAAAGPTHQQASLVGPLPQRWHRDGHFPNRQACLNYAHSQHRWSRWECRYKRLAPHHGWHLWYWTH